VIRRARVLLSLNGLTGEGRSIAVRVWLVLWSHVKWPSRFGARQVSRRDVTLAEECACHPSSILRALGALERAGLIKRSWGRQAGVTKPVRVIELAPGRGVVFADTPVFKLPPPAVVSAIRDRLARVGPEDPGDRDSPLVLHDRAVEGCKPGSVLALAMALCAMASLESSIGGPGQGREPDHGVLIKTSMAALRELTGAGPGGATFTDRLRKIEAAGLIQRVGEQWRDGIVVVPARVVLGCHGQGGQS
jgi:hypothetical protein